MKEFFNNHRWSILLSVAAILLVVLIVLIGWWTLLLLVLVAVAIGLGYLLDKGGPHAVRDFFRKLFKGE